MKNLIRKCEVEYSAGVYIDESGEPTLKDIVSKKGYYHGCETEIEPSGTKKVFAIVEMVDTGEVCRFPMTKIKFTSGFLDLAEGERMPPKNLN